MQQAVASGDFERCITLREKVARVCKHRETHIYIYTTTTPRAHAHAHATARALSPKRMPHSSDVYSTHTTRSAFGRGLHWAACTHSRLHGHAVHNMYRQSVIIITMTHVYQQQQSPHFYTHTRVRNVVIVAALLL